MTTEPTRLEHDLLGEKAVPADAYYGVQTARALENFAISGIELRLYPGKSHVDLVKSLSPTFRGTTPALADSVAFLAAHSR